MRLGWKVFLPISLFMVVATAAFLKITGIADGGVDRRMIGLARHRRFVAMRACRVELARSRRC